MKSVLYPIEVVIYFCFWTFAILYSWYTLFEAQKKILNSNDQTQYEITDLKPGWNIISRLIDVSEMEWGSWHYFMSSSWFYLIAQFGISELIRNNIKKPVNLKYWYIISSAMFITLEMGIRHLLIITVQPLIFLAVVLCEGRKLSIWITSILMLIGYNSLKYSTLWDILEHENLYDEEVYLLLICIAWVLLRCISFCIDYVERNQTSNDTNKIGIIVNMFSYILYTPLLYHGPVILYGEFEKSFHVEIKETFYLKLKKFIVEMLKLCFYSILMDVSLHYIYFYALQNDMQAIRKLSTIALCGGCLWMGAQFYVKYVIIYGTTTAFARLDDIKTPPKPRCVLTIHAYSDMWRYFDVGLYKFLVRYIFKPTCDLLANYIEGPRTQKLLASLSSFVFIFAWHGFLANIFIWTVLNYLSVTLEYAGKAITESESYKWFRRTVLRSDAMELRFTCVCCAPFLGISIIASSYLFGNYDLGNLYINKFLHPTTFTNSLIVGFSLYSCCMVSKNLRYAPSKDYQNIKKGTEVCNYKKINT